MEKTVHDVVGLFSPRIEGGSNVGHAGKGSAEEIDS
jgi:hypothetical protein